MLVTTVALTIWFASGCSGDGAEKCFVWSGNSNSRGHFFMLGWLRNKAHTVVVSEVTEYIERHTYALRRSSDDDVGLVLASATFWRLYWTNAGLLPSGAISLDGLSDEIQCAKFRSDLSRQIKEEQKSSPAGTIGLVVWLNTSRSLNMPELRTLGREMWVELRRGVPFAPPYLPRFFAAAGVPLPANAHEALGFVPRGLEAQ